MAKKTTEEKKGFFSHWIVRNLLTAGIIAAAMLVGAIIFLNVATQHGREYTVPDFRGMTIAEAVAAADSIGMRVEVVDSIYSQRNRGKVKSHNPHPGAKVKKGRRILLTVNAVNARKVSIPNLVGYSLRQAIPEVDRKGLTLGKLIYKSDMATNNVLEQQYKGKPVEPGSLVEAESVIDLVVGLNPNDNATKVPSLTGLDAKDAVKMLHDSYLNVNKLNYDKTVKTYEDSLYARVYRQNPEPSELTVPMGTYISIYLKKAGEEE